jgi:hypothetical protein
LELFREWAVRGRDVGKQVISDTRLWFCQRDQIGLILYTTNPVGMEK